MRATPKDFNKAETNFKEFWKCPSYKKFPLSSSETKLTKRVPFHSMSSDLNSEFNKKVPPTGIKIRDLGLFRCLCAALPRKLVMLKVSNGLAPILSDPLFDYTIF